MILGVILTLVTGVGAVAAPNADIRINQLGYAPRATKRVIVAQTSATTFEVRDAAGVVRLRGPLIDRGRWAESQEDLKSGDFSELAALGTYTIAVADKGQSASFEIGEQLYAAPLAAAVKSFYYQRASLALEPRYAGRWARPAGHPDTRCLFHPSSGRASGTLSSPGGWYDAGDDNKYIVNAAITVVTMLLLHEQYPEVLGDGTLNIPESGNGIPDLLDEIRYELDWALTMQDPDDGGVYFKLTSKAFPGMIMPHEDQSERFVVGKSTASALDFAAMTAHAARVWRPLDAAFAARCEKAAVRAWQWAKAHPDVVFHNPPGVQTGAYSPTILEDDFFHAAAQLLVTTGDEEYLRYVRGHWRDLRMVEGGVGGSWATYVHNVATYVLASRPSRLTDEERQRLRQSIVTLAEGLLARIEANPHRVPLERFNWGSNGTISDEAILLAQAFRIAREPRLLGGVLDLADYLFGRNATGYSFLTGFGVRSPLFIHHRASAADGIEAPIPGFLVGGPNGNREDDVSRVSWGVKYPSTAPAKSYVDLVGSYASNEVCINWNASLVYVLAFLVSEPPRTPR